MGHHPVAVVDTNVLLNLSTPVVDGREFAPSGEDPLKTVLTVYDVHIPESVLGEVTDATGSGDLLSAAADAVLAASRHLTVHDVTAHETTAVGLDRGESDAIRLANELPAHVFVTDEFNATNHLLVSQAIADRNTLFTTPHVLCHLARGGALTVEYVDALLTYFVATKGWDDEYIDALRRTHLR